jgi:hypothetical protein
MHSKSARLENEFRIQAKRPRTQRWLDSEYFKKLEKKVLARLRGNFGHEKE